MTRRRARLASLCVAVLTPLTWTHARAGTFSYADEGTEDRIAHPSGYTGSTASLTVSVCIDPTSANAADMAVPVQNAIDVWNGQAETTGNLLVANVPFAEYDFESLALHEMGHCIGLGHPNVGSQAGIPTSADREYTASTDGNPAMTGDWNLGAGTDGIIGTDDDVRGDDENLHYFRISNNDPFTLASTVDSTTYSKDLTDLPVTHLYAANCDRDVGADLGYANTECVMQQGTSNGEAQRTLGHDDVATLQYGMSGLDRTVGGSDDYTVQLSYAGLTSSCDIVFDFDDAQTSFAACSTVGSFLDFPTNNHIAITSANVYVNTGTQMGNEFDWFFNPVRLGTTVPTLPHWALLAIALFIATVGVRVLRRAA